MGKKTTKMINECEEFMTECKQHIDDYFTNYDAFEKLLPTCQSFAAPLTKRYNELLVIHKKDLEATRQSLFTDPEYLRIDAEADKVLVQTNAAEKGFNDAKRELGISLGKLDRKLQVFETFITKKAKSKNPFKSKKSIPAAKDFITAAREFHANTLKFLG